MKKELVRTILTALVVAVVVGGYFRLEGALPIAVTQTLKQATYDVQGEGKIAVKPDTGVITLGFQKEAGTVKAATEGVDSIMNKLSEELAKLGVEKKEIKTIAYNVYQNYQPDGTRGKTFSASSSVEVVVKDLEKIPQVMELIGTLGLNQSGGLRFELSEELLKTTRREAREMAVAEAKAKAEELAGLAGLKLVRVINVQENSGGYVPVAMAANREIAKDAGMPSIEPGSNEVVVVVTLSYETR